MDCLGNDLGYKWKATWCMISHFRILREENTTQSRTIIFICPFSF